MQGILDNDEKTVRHRLREVTSEITNMTIHNDQTDMELVVMCLEEIDFILSKLKDHSHTLL